MQSPQPIPFTQAGFAKLPAELEKLQKYREEVLIRLQRAREMGDLSENGAYKTARFELSDTDRNIRRLQHLLKYGVVVTAPTDGSIGVGSTVRLVREDGSKVTYEIVGTYEANPLHGKISLESPMGLALVGKRVGEKVVVVVMPDHQIEYLVKTIL